MYVSVQPQTYRILYLKPSPWSKGSFEVPLLSSVPKAVVIELGMGYLQVKHNKLIQETSSARLQALMINSLIFHPSALQIRWKDL